MTQRFLAFVKRQAATGPPDHDRAFLDRFETLYAYARRLVDGDRVRADDLVQDAYVQFITARPDVASIRDVDAYLVTLLRNLHVSTIRRTAAHRDRLVPLHEYDSGALALASCTNDDHVRACETLADLCRFACERKESSRSASVLLLRFFHDCYPSEIAYLLRTTPQAVHASLWQARREARTWLGAHEERRPADRSILAPHRVPSSPNGADDVIAQLRAAIFATTRPPCLSAAAIARWTTVSSQPLDARTCSHIASCRDCLSRLRARVNPLDSDEAPPSADGNDGVNGQTSSERRAALHIKGTRRARGLREHRPQQLEVSVNGHPIGHVRVTSDRNEFRWAVRLDEPLAFAELHSEQGVRMALLHVELPPAGQVVQQVRFALSDHRWLGLALDFSGLHPAIAVEYVDPALRSAAADTALDDLAPAPPSAAAEPTEAVPARATPERRSWWSRIWHTQRRRWWLASTTVLALMASATWWTDRRSRAIPPPSVLLDQAATREATSTPGAAAVHRTLIFEVRRPDARIATFTRRIEAWTRSDTNARAVRVFDEAGHLVAGQWPAGEVIELGRLDDVWQAELSADTFRRRYAPLGSCASAVAPATYVITCEPPRIRSLIDRFIPEAHAQAATRPVRAALTLRRVDLHAVRLDLTSEVDGVNQHVTLQERALVHVMAADVPPGVFEPETRGPSTPEPAVTSPRARRIPVKAPASLEVRVLEIVDRLAANEYLSVRRTPSGAIDVTGLVPTPQAKQALLAAVGEIKAAPLIKTEIQTFAEVAERERRSSRPQSGAPAEARVMASVVGAAPIAAYIGTRVPPGTDVTALVRALTPRVLRLSERLKRHALALSAFLERFDDHTVTEFDDDGRRAWRAVIDRHAAETLTALESLESTLTPYFDEPSITSDASAESIRHASLGLVNEAGVLDGALRDAFTVSASPVANRPSVPSDIREHIHRATVDVRTIRRLISPSPPSWETAR